MAEPNGDWVMMTQYLYRWTSDGRTVAEPHCRVIFLPRQSWPTEPTREAPGA